MTADEMEAAASPFLYRGVSARIAAERERRARSALWVDLLMAWRRTVPAMLAIGATLAGCLSIGHALFKPSSADASDPRLERVVLTGTAVLSDDDVLRFLINWPVAKETGERDSR